MQKIERDQEGMEGVGTNLQLQVIYAKEQAMVDK